MKNLLRKEVYENFLKYIGEFYPYQKEVAENIAKGENVLIIAPTGYGKTFAAMLPILSSIDRNKRGIKCIYITPLRALNRDIFKQLASFADKVNIEIDIRHGDTTAYQKKQQSDMPPDILVTTPETLQGVLTGYKLREHLKHLKYVVVDEIHELFEDKRGAQLAVALERLEEISHFQRVGLSATIGDPRTISKYLVGVGRKCKIVNVRDKKVYNIEIEPPGKLNHELMNPKVAYTIERIVELVNNHNKTLIFVNTREAAEMLGSVLKGRISVEVHHSSLSKDSRTSAEEKFKEGKLKALIATSSLELGIDIGDVDLVIQYMSPRQVTKLIQRVGRAGHKIDRSSKGVILTINNDDYIESMAILRKIEQNWIEKPTPPIKPLDVLAHQIVGITIQLGGASKERIISIIKRAYPYKSLTRQEFEDVIKLMKKLNLIYEKDVIIRKRQGIRYYFNNVSMIPDEKQYYVIDRELNKRVGILHEGFVAQHIDIGVAFIMKGEVWRVAEIEGNKIYVVRSHEEAAVPSWEGELIPVAREVAESAAEIRKTITKHPADKDNIVIEHYKNYVVIHSTYGTKINTTLSKIIGAMLTTEIGKTIGIRSDAYRIVFELPHRWKISEQLFKSLNDNWIEFVLKTSIKNSSLYLYRFKNVAKRFGIIERDQTVSQLRRLIKIFEGTPVETETFSEIEREKMDVEGVKEVVNKIKSGEIKVLVRNTISKVGLDGLEWNFPSFIRPDRERGEIYSLVDKRLNNRRVFLVCTRCWTPLGERRVGNIDELKCPKCGAKTIGIIPKRNKEKIMKIVKKVKKTEEERRMIKEVELSGELYLNYGWLAAYVLAAYGVGPRTAVRILKKRYDSKDKIIEEILKEERKYIKNKQFWKE